VTGQERNGQIRLYPEGSLESASTGEKFEEYRVMKSRDALIRLKRFEVEEKRRKVAEIETMIAALNPMATDLDRQIAIEQERAGITDVNHYAYPTFAKAAMARRNNLAVSA